MKHKNAYKITRKFMIHNGRWVDGPPVFGPISFYFRNIGTAQEIKNTSIVDYENRHTETPVKIRRSRAGKALCSWNLERPQSMAFKRSWKRFYKAKKQWVVKL